MYDLVENLRTIGAADSFGFIVVVSYIGGSAALSVLGPAGSFY